MTPNLKSCHYTDNILISSLPCKELNMISTHIRLFFCCLMLCLLLSFDARFVNSQPLAFYCPDNTIYNSSSASGRVYRANLDFLLSTLTSNASRPDGFYNFTAGSDPSIGTVVYGLFLCRGDTTATDCQDCVATASSEILANCTDRNAAVIWYDNCTLRFSNQRIFSRVDSEVSIIMVNVNNTSTDTQTLLNTRIVLDTMDQIVNSINQEDPWGKKFAAQEQETNRSTLPRRVFALGQCTPDLSSTDCNDCLVSAIKKLPTDRQGARVLFPSCNIRYETDRFYNTLPSPPLPPPPPPPSPSPPPSPATSGQGNGGMSTGTIVAIVVPIAIALVLLVVIFFYFCRARRSRKAHNVVNETSGTSAISYKESLQYNLSEIQAFTNNFDPSNRIGEGGFGPVYKGTLPNGQEIAVKRLSRSSSQGAEEFINEITLVAKLQHRNLVRLLGYCLDGEEKVLVYEFVPNKSLDYFLFDPEKQALLDWSTRYEIIGGIARGLLYLHRDSRLRIIHRDLKASNVLLDPNMNPKIADFGMARLFEFDQIEGNTSKIAGTLGYMAPEYTSHGLFSAKSDVFSFGVLVLEIISGRKNSNFSQSHSEIELLITCAWRQWRDGTPLALVDSSLGSSYVRKEVIQCIQIGLLCVQEDAKERPTMASVVAMLNSYSITLPTPNQPAYYGLSYSKELPSESEKPSTKKSRNEASITELYPR